MRGESKIISNFMAGEGGAKFHFQIPVYQRPYSWTKAQCLRLYDDMVSTFQENRDSHFIGSIVYQVSSKSGTKVYTIIDGQQRLTTLYLLFLAMRQVALDLGQQLKNGTYDEDLVAQEIIVLDDSESEAAEPTAMGLNQDQLQEYAEEIFNRFLSNKFRAKSRQEQLRFHLIESDQPALEKLFAGEPKEFEADSLLTKNFKLFYQQVLHEKRLRFDELLDLASNLSFISIELERDDDAQLIFESLNSTGLKLSEGDKIRNYMLMQFSDEKQQSLYYHDYWKKIDANCGADLDLFVKDYLSTKLGRSPSKKELYQSFKLSLASDGGKLDPDDARVRLVELVEYSKLFWSMSTCHYEVPEPLEPSLSDFKREQLQTSIEQCLKRLKFLPYAVCNPFIMQCMMLHQRGQLSGEELLEVCHIVETFVLRRWVCQLRTDGLNRFFQNLHASLNASKEDGGLVQKLGKILLQNTSETNRLPNDAEFEKALRQNNLYLNSRSKNAIYYLFERLENGDNLESVPILDRVERNQLSIEHIMPQTLSPEWESALGANALSVHKTWLHRLGNLTLTAYNSKYSNSSFEEKCSTEKGFNESGLRLNRDLCKFKRWDEKAMQKRTDDLVKKALKIWPLPKP